MKKYIIQFSVALLSLTSCMSDNINDDPNSAYTTVPETLVSYAQKELSDYMNTPNVNTNNFRLTMQYWQESTYVDESNYDFINRNVSNNIWSNNYVNVLMNLNQAKNIINNYVPTASEVATWNKKKANQLAIIEIMMVYVYQNMVDTFGNIPYSESLQVGEHSLPKYDDASQVYINLIERLKVDISSLNTANSFGSGDYYYQGNVSKWRKFGNSLLLKLGIAIADSNSALAQSTVNSAILGGVMTSSADDCKLNYLATSPNYNPLYQNLAASGRDDFFAGKTLVDYMLSKSDSRISSYFGSVDGEYVGGEIGQPGEFEEFSSIGDFAYTPDTPGVIMNHTEVAFYLAEAAARWDSANAEVKYNEAVKASFKEWGVENESDAYLIANPYDASNWKKSIGEQAWVAMFNQGHTSWNFYRRLDYPILSAPATAVANAENKVPVRMTYPVREQSVNSTNWESASTAIGGDKLTTKLFWDKF